MTMKTQDLAYAIYRYTENSNQNENYFKAKRLVNEIKAFKTMKTKTLAIRQAYMRPWPLKLYDETQMFWLRTLKEVDTFFKDQADPSFDGCLTIPLGCIGGTKGKTNSWLSDCDDSEEVYSEQINELIAKYFPSIKGLVWKQDIHTNHVPKGFDEEYGLQDLPPSLTYLSLDFQGPLDLSCLSWTSIVYLNLGHQNLGFFIDEYPFPFDHPYPKLRLVETPYTSHRSCDWCSLGQDDRLFSFRKF